VLANAGLPMIMVAMPVMLYALLPIVLIEAYVLRRSLHVSTGRSLVYAAVSNLVSTLVGIPLTWLILVAFQLLTGGGGAYGIQTLPQKILAVTWQAPWLIPYEGSMKWMVPSAMLVLLIPFFFASWFCEYWTIRLLGGIMVEAVSNKEIKKACLYANAVTYGAIAVLGVCLILSNNVPMM